MYKLSIIVLLFVFCNAESQIWKKQLDSLITKEQYLNAYELLMSNSQKDSVEVLLNKSVLALDYYASSQYHRRFGFVNVRPGESLDEIRKRQDIVIANYYLPIDTLLMNQLVLHPTDYRIHLQLAKYYNSVFLQFGDRWGRKSEWLLDQSQHFFTEAYKNGVYDYYSLYAMGYYNTLIENYHEARYWFTKSLQVKEEPLTHYNLAVSCLFDGMFSEGVKSAVRSYELYIDSLKKGDAARIAGILYSKLEQKTEALEFFIIANDLSPNYKPNQLYLLKSYLNRSNLDEAIKLANEVLKQNIYSPDLFQELLDMFEQEQQLELLKNVFDQTLKNAGSDYEASGNVLFHYAKLEYELGHKNKARRYLKESKQHFSNVFDSGHQVFQAIDQMLDHL